MPIYIYLYVLRAPDVIVLRESLTGSNCPTTIVIMYVIKRPVISEFSIARGVRTIVIDGETVVFTKIDFTTPARAAPIGSLVT